MPEQPLFTHPTCPVCAWNLAAPLKLRGAQNTTVDCANCGVHKFSPTALKRARASLGGSLLGNQVAHQLTKVAPDVTITTHLLVRFEQMPLPGPTARIDNYVLYLGSSSPAGTPDPASTRSSLRARLGCENKEAARWVVVQAEALGYISEERTLSLKGWQRFEELQRAAGDSRYAFMAMKFNDAELQRVFAQHIRPAVQQTGYELRAANHEGQPAGPIDDTMRVQIRTSRFVICDLTHGNRGAYWEAGFAEGIGRPVIFVCKATVLDDATHDCHPHFDTRNHLIVAWDPANMGEFKKRLKNAIRATLPNEARMED